MVQVIEFTQSAAMAKRRAKRGQKFWVYVVCWRRRGPCKIGITDDVQARLVGLQTGSPHKLHLFRAYGFDSPGASRKVEGTAHALAGVRRMQGEWVDMPAKDAALLVLRAIEVLGLRTVPYDKRKAAGDKKKARWACY